MGLDIDLLRCFTDSIMWIEVQKPNLIKRDNLNQGLLRTISESILNPFRLTLRQCDNDLQFIYITLEWIRTRYTAVTKALYASKLLVRLPDVFIITSLFQEVFLHRYLLGYSVLMIKLVRYYCVPPYQSLYECISNLFNTYN